MRDDKNLSTITVKTYNEMVHPTYYPGSRWLSLKALANASVAEIFSYAVDVAFIPPPEKADSFDRAFWKSFVYCSLRTVTSKVSSLEHLNQIAAKACFNITGDIRTRVAEGLQSAWKRMGFPVSEETQKRFSVDRVGGLQKLICEGGESNFRSLLFKMGQQRNKTCLKTASNMVWDILVSHWIDKGDPYDSQRESIAALYDIFFKNEDYVPTPTEVMNFASSLLQLHSRMDHDDEIYEELFFKSRYLAFS
ncbi:unnamed protein product [Ambrosiozyma monospora]|uniref:Unnamed protein product n=1 Tax=Ambrosiozyma monospora TaxID=43982 RepID=A0ACB5TU86_AMBMO|nr:unnamed protein product [Ambrosiozyma monospora]